MRYEWGDPAPPVFSDRRDAGRRLGARLRSMHLTGDLLVAGLPRGGVPVAYEIARALAAPLDVLVVRKVGLPGQSELAMGAIASGGVRILNRPVIAAARVPMHVFDEVAAREQAELVRREQRYRGGRPEIDPAGRHVVLVDDGLATGSSMMVAIEALRRRGAGEITVAVPVGPPDTCQEVAALADRTVCLVQPADFRAVGQWYIDFSPTTDEEVESLLRWAQQPPAGGGRLPPEPGSRPA